LDFYFDIIPFKFVGGGGGCAVFFFYYEASS
jgi:hypothetical protein